MKCGKSPTERFSKSTSQKKGLKDSGIRSAFFDETDFSIFSLHTVSATLPAGREGQAIQVSKRTAKKEEQGHSTVDVKECEVNSFQLVGLNQFVFKDKQDTDDEQN